LESKEPYFLVEKEMPNTQISDIYYLEPGIIVLVEGFDKPGLPNLAGIYLKIFTIRSFLLQKLV
jgi:hypothetical protein